MRPSGACRVQRASISAAGHAFLRRQRGFQIEQSRRGRIAGADVVHQHVRRTIFVGQRFHQAAHRAAHGIGENQSFRRLLHGDRSDGDEAAPAPRLHQRQRLFGEINRAHQVELAGGVPIGIGGFGKGFRRRTAGIGHADIHAPEALVGLGHEAAHLVVRRHIQGARQHLTPVSRADLLGRLVQRGFGARAQRQPRALARQPERHGFAQALAGCGYDGHPVFQS